MLLKPYSSTNAGVYGHYGILLAPFVWMFGGDLAGFARVMSLLSVLWVCALFYVLDKLVENRFLRVLGSVSFVACLVSASRRPYYQCWPHRLVFPALVLAYIVWQHRHRKYDLRWKIIGFALCALALVWNFETGFGCVAGYAGSWIVMILQERRLDSFHTWKRICRYLLSCVMTFVMAYAFVQVYNVAVGGSIEGVKSFLFPLVGVTYVGDLGIALMNFAALWMLVVLVIFLVVCVVLSTTSLCGAGGEIADTRVVCLSAVAIIGAVQVMYYMNRSVHGNLFIALPFTYIMACYLVDRILHAGDSDSSMIGSGCHRALATMMIFFMAVVGLIGVINFCTYDSERIVRRNYSELEQFAYTVKDNVDINAVAIGVGMDAIYSILGWDTGYYGIDMPDYVIGSEEITRSTMEILTSAQSVFVNENDKNNIGNLYPAEMEAFLATHYQAWTATYGDSTYAYYRLVE